MISLHTPAHSYLRLLALLYLAGQLSFSQTVAWKPDSTLPIIQLTGEHFQLYSDGVHFTDLTTSQTVTSDGLLGADLGYPVVYPDKILFFFGDSPGVFRGYRERSDRFYLAGGPRGIDSIGYIPNMDLDGCNYIVETQRELQNGKAHPKASTKDCPTLRLYRNPHPRPGEPAFMPTTIHGLKSDEGTGPYETPSGAFDHDGRIYLWYVVKVQEAKPHFALRSILAKADQPTSSWSDRHPPTFTRLFAVSSHDAVADPANPPDEATGPGKFMFDPVATMTHDELDKNHLLSGLPSELAKAGEVAFVFGSSFRYNRSDLYLAAFAAADVEKGMDSWFYYSGKDQSGPWSKDEKDAVPLLGGQPNIGNHSVGWNAALRRFVLMYGNIMVRTAQNPWGPWSAATQIFPPRGAWAQRMTRHTEDNPIEQFATPVFRHRTNQRFEFREDKRGIPYGPYILDKYSRNSDGSVTLFFTMSTWVPYQVFLMKTTFEAK